MVLTMNRSLSRFQLEILSCLSLHRVVIVGLSEKAPRKRGCACFLCTEEKFIVKRFLQKMRVLRKIFSLKIRAYQAALQDACHDTLSRHPDHDVPPLSAIQRRGVLKRTLSGCFTVSSRGPAGSAPRGCRLAFLNGIG